MTTASSHLALAKPTTSDDFDTAEIAQNLETIDKSPGVFLCTQGTRPATWGSAHKGMLIYETDRDLYWMWTGSVFVRFKAKGWLNGSRRQVDLSTSSLSPVTLVSTAAAVPTGGRRVAVVVSWCAIENDTGLTKLYLFRDAQQLAAWQVQGDSDATLASEKSQGGSFTFFEAPGEGTFTYSLQFSAVTGLGGTSWVRASATTPCSIDVVEQ